MTSVCSPVNHARCSLLHSVSPSFYHSILSIIPGHFNEHLRWMCVPITALLFAFVSVPYFATLLNCVSCNKKLSVSYYQVHAWSREVLSKSFINNNTLKLSNDSN
ncbi:hypothetical protein BDR26DRAFT_84863 [Obelidium mucronatum]|nr:hypothetical protein BDR26DRAFT_84863 [Obelidium mucronatum]